MKGTGTILAAIGVIVVIVALINHFVTTFLSFTHASIIIGVVGAVVLAIGLYMSMSGRKAAA